MTRLRRSDCSGPGIRRQGRGKGFEYFDSVTGEKITDTEVLDRIRGLAVPPAWAAVWICPWHNGHLQAVGTDDAGRKQYLYHDKWRSRRDAEKFDRMLDFARCLPAMREVIAEALAASQKPTRERVLAGAVRLLDHGFFRIGGETYAEENDSFGLATMRKEHVAIRGGDTIEFDYPSKGRKRRVMHLVDEDVVDLVATLRRRRTGGDGLLAYRAQGAWKDLTAADVNDYIKDHCGQDATAKDFRTWNATVLAAVGVAVSGQAVGTKTARNRAISRACEEVGHYLGNTPAVARNSYIDPRVFDRYESGWTIRGALEALGAEAAYGVPSYQGAIEEAVLDLLERRTGSAALERTDAV